MFTRLAALIVKELLTTFRDPKARVALIVPPILQLLLFAFAATLEVSNVPLGVINDDWGSAATELMSRFERASAFSEIRLYRSVKDAQAAIDSQQVMAVVHIGQDFSRNLESGATPTLQILLDGRKSNSAQIVNNYISTIVATFAADQNVQNPAAAPSTVVDRSWYNPNRDYREAMVPILIATLPMALVLMTVGMSVAREQELGTFEQLLVSPLQPIEIILGKSVPGLIIGLGQCVLMTLIVRYGFGITITGSIFLLFVALTVFLMSIIGVALFISSLVSNQQQAMMGIMVCMMPAMMLSGFSSPVQNMPVWLQPVAEFNPLTHMLVIVRGVFLRDMAFAQIAREITPMAVVSVLTLIAAAWMFRRKVQ